MKTKRKMQYIRQTLDQTQKIMNWNQKKKTKKRKAKRPPKHFNLKRNYSFSYTIAEEECQDEDAFQQEMNGQNTDQAESEYENIFESNENINNVGVSEQEQITIGPTSTDERPLLARPHLRNACFL